jgi:hypothetical protein
MPIAPPPPAYATQHERVNINNGQKRVKRDITITIQTGMVQTDGLISRIATRYRGKTNSIQTTLYFNITNNVEILIGQTYPANLVQTVFDEYINLGWTEDTGA